MRNRLICLLGLLSLTGHGVFAATQAGVPVAVVEAKELPIFREVQLTGTVTSPQVAMLSAATSGVVMSVLAEAGTRVSVGNTLLTLDAELAQLQLQSATAKVAQVRNALLDAERRLREARVLVPQRSISESAVRDIEAEVESERAALQQAEAEANYRRALLDRHQLKAPFPGVVSKKLVEQGEWIAPGQGAFELVATGDTGSASPPAWWRGGVLASTTTKVKAFLGLLS